MTRQNKAHLLYLVAFGIAGINFGLSMGHWHGQISRDLFRMLVAAFGMLVFGWALSRELFKVGSHG